MSPCPRCQSTSPRVTDADVKRTYAVDNGLGAQTPINLHPSTFFDPTDPDSTRRGHEAFSDLVDLAIALGGTISGEQGIGTIKAPYLPRQVGDAAMERMRAIKAVFDPHGICNPGKSYA